MPRRAQSPPDRPQVAARSAPPVLKARRGAPRRRQRGQLGHHERLGLRERLPQPGRPGQPGRRRPNGRRRRDLCALLVLLALAAAPAPTRGDELAIAEPTPVAELGPPQSRGAGAQITAEGVTVRVSPSRRSAAATARWRLRAAPGLLQLQVPSSLRPVTFVMTTAGCPDGSELAPVAPASADERARAGVVVEDVAALDEVLPPVPEARIDPGSAAVYTLPAPPPAPAERRDRPAAERVAHLITVEIPPSGTAVLCATATLSSGFDRRHWRRTNFEQAHARLKRKDPFVYHFALRGPAGPLKLLAGADTAAQGRMLDGVIRASAAERRPAGVGLTLGIGPAIGPAPPPDGQAGTEPAGDLLVQGLVRAALDILLPHRDALALSVEAGSELRADHHVGAALVYQLYTPAWPYLPIGGHLDLGASCDLWQSRGVGLGLSGAPSLRCGGRLGLAANVGFVSLAPSVDIFPPLRETAAGSTHFTAQYRVAILVTVGL